VVISVTDEEIGLVNDFIAEFKVSHPVVILKGGALEDLIGVSGFPTSAVFSNGELQWTGHPAESSSAVAKAMKSAKKGSVYPKSLAKARQLIKANQQAAAYADIGKSQAKLTGNDAAWASRVRTWLEEESSAALTGAKAEAETGFLFRALERVKGFGGAESTLPNAAEIREWVAGVEAGTPEFKKELSGGKSFEEAVALEKQLLYAEAFKAYKSILGKAKGTQIAANAEKAARVILEGFKAGYNPNCESCDAKDHRACTRHREDLKL
jgi:hypothetical protein